MKLSEAIRAGAKIRPQAHGGLYETSEKAVCTNGVLGLVIRQRVTSCALGAAFEAADCETITAVQDEGEPFRGNNGPPGTLVKLIQIPREWYPVFRFGTECPQCTKPDTVHRLIPHLNDDHRWKREEIALWVERIERTVEWLAQPEPEANVYSFEEVKCLESGS